MKRETSRKANKINGLAGSVPLENFFEKSLKYPIDR